MTLFFPDSTSLHGTHSGVYMGTVQGLHRCLWCLPGHCAGPTQVPVVSTLGVRST